MADPLGAIKYGVLFPDAGGGNFNFVASTISSSTSKAETVFRARESATITHWGYRCNAITGTSPLIKCGFQGVGTDGNPDGTYLGGGSPASAVFAPSALGHTAANWYWITLDNPIAVNAGDRISWVAEYDSGTVDGSNNIAISSTISTGSLYRFPFAIVNASGTRTRQAGLPVYGYKSSSKSYGNPMKTSSGNTSFSSASNPNEYALAFQIPTTFGTTFTIRSFCVDAGLTVGHTVRFSLYSGTNTTPIIFTDLDTDLNSSSSSGTYMVSFTGVLPTLQTNTIYRLSMAPQDSTSQSIKTITQDTSADWTAYPGSTTCWLSTRNGGSWTDDLTRRPVFSVILSDLVTPVGNSTAYIIS